MPRWLRRIAIGLAVMLAVAVAIHVASVVRLDGERRAHARSDGQLHRVVHGSGPPIVFLPGFLGTTRYFEGEFDDAARAHRLVMIDPIGFGRSPWPILDYDLDDHLAAIEATLSAETGTRTITLVGHSFGALLAAYYAVDHPDQVEHVVLLGLPIFEDEADAKKRIGGLSPLAEAFVLNENIAAAGCDIVCAFRPWVRDLMPALMPDRRAVVASDSMLHTWPSFHGTLTNVLIDQRAASPVMMLKDKVTLIHASADEISPLARARRLAEQSGAELVAVEGGHHAYLEPARRWLAERFTTTATTGHPKVPR